MIIKTAGTACNFKRTGKEEEGKKKQFITLLHKHRVRRTHIVLGKCVILT